MTQHKTSHKHAKFYSLRLQPDSMVVINFLDQLQSGTFEHAIHYLVENELDLSVYFSSYKNETNGRPAYDPGILLKTFLFAYSKGITSSREIEWCCRTNIIFKALSCDSEYGKLIYSHRISVIEPVFGNIGTNKGLNRFSLRGNKKVQNQWILYCLVHNIEKLKNYGNIAA